MLEILDLRYGRSARGQPPAGPLRLTVRPGELLALDGPRGGGRSELLRTLAGRGPVHAGELRWNGRLLSAQERRCPTRVALLSEGELPCGPRLPVREALRLGAGLLGLPGPTVAEALTRWGLGGVADGAVGAQCSGVRELLALALLELCEAPITLLDHPLGHLDAAGQRCLSEWLDRQRARSGVVLWASPSERLLPLADRVAELAGGRLGTVRLRGGSPA